MKFLVEVDDAEIRELFGSDETSVEKARYDILNAVASESSFLNCEVELIPKPPVHSTCTYQVIVDGQEFFITCTPKEIDTLRVLADALNSAHGEYTVALYEITPIDNGGVIKLAEALSKAIRKKDGIEAIDLVRSTLEQAEGGN